MNEPCARTPMIRTPALVLGGKVVGALGDIGSKNMEVVETGDVQEDVCEDHGDFRDFSTEEPVSC